MIDENTTMPEDATTDVAASDATTTDTSAAATETSDVPAADAATTSGDTTAAPEVNSDVPAIDLTPVPGLKEIIVSALGEYFTAVNSASALSPVPISASTMELNGDSTYHSLSVEKLDNGFVLHSGDGKHTFFHGLDELLVHAATTFQKAFNKI